MHLTSPIEALLARSHALHPESGAKTQDGDKFSRQAHICDSTLFASTTTELYPQGGLFPVGALNDVYGSIGVSGFSFFHPEAYLIQQGKQVEEGVPGQHAAGAEL